MACGAAPKTAAPRARRGRGAVERPRVVLTQAVTLHARRPGPQRRRPQKSARRGAPYDNSKTADRRPKLTSAGIAGSATPHSSKFTGKRNIKKIIAATFAAAALVGIQSSALAAGHSPCSLETLHGTYLWSGQDLTSGGEAGWEYYDGEGNVIGNSSGQDYAGTYTVKGCVTTITFTSGLLAGDTDLGYLSPSGDNFVWSGAQQGGTEYRVSRDNLIKAKEGRETCRAPTGRSTRNARRPPGALPRARSRTTAPTRDSSRGV